MRFDRPRIIALNLALVTTILAGIMLLLLDHFFELELSVLVILIPVLILGIIAFIVIRFAIEYFIYNKVKIIYRNIHELKVGSKQDENEMVRSSSLDQVSREVAEWAEQRQMEIKQLKERENFRREFIGNISHELKTPVFNIQGYLLTLLDGALDDPGINRKYLKRANKSVDRMINIIEDLEVISNLEANRVQLVMSSFDIVELVREVFELLDGKAGKRRMKLRLRKNYDKPLRVVADRPKIEQVLVNLVSNAIKYGREKGQVEVGFSDMDEHLLIEVSDDGIGIPEEDIPRIFERFYRVDKSRSREAGGTGLGLAIVKHILEAHGQRIRARSSEENGSTFSFSLKKAK